MPVCFEEEYGPDLAELAAHASIQRKEAVELLCSAAYRVHMIGFMPGFPYMGGLPEQLAAPRRTEPRLAVPAGSVGIAGKQIGIYPFASPGGWQLIGRTPLRLFDPERTKPSLLAAGDQVSFRPIAKEEFRRLQGGEGKHEHRC